MAQETASPAKRTNRRDDFIKLFKRVQIQFREGESKLDCMLTLRNAMPEFFNNWDPMRPEIQEVLSVGCMLPLPGYDNMGRKVIFFRSGAHDPEKIQVEDLQKASFMIWDLLMKQDEQMFITGIVLIADVKDFTMAHIAKFPLPLMKKMSTYWEEANPLRPKAAHHINTPAIFNTIMGVFFSLMKEKMRRRIKIHVDMESMLKEVPLEVLPKDYGGSTLSVAELTEYWKKECEENRQYLIGLEKMKADESRRPGRPKTSADLFGMEGSFRKLNID